MNNVCDISNQVINSVFLFFSFVVDCYCSDTLTHTQERFRSLIPSYIRDSTVAVVVYDITSEYKRLGAAMHCH